MPSGLVLGGAAAHDQRVGRLGSPRRLAQQLFSGMLGSPKTSSPRAPPGKLAMSFSMLLLLRRVPDPDLPGNAQACLDLRPWLGIAMAGGKSRAAS